MIFSLIYFISIFIFGILALSKSTVVVTVGRERSEIRFYHLLCILYAGWCFFSVCASFVEIDILKHVALLLADFFEILSFCVVFEIMAFLTKMVEKARTKIIRISSGYLYGGILILFLFLTVARANIYQDSFGVHFVSNNHVIEVFLIIYFFTILFGLSYMILAYFEECSKPREKYACGIYVGILILSFVGMVLELLGLFLLNAHIPSLILSYGLILIILNKAISYKRRIEYYESSYPEELSPVNPTAIGICNDEGEVLFINKRLSVMTENFRDNIIGKNIFESYNISGEDKAKVMNFKGADGVEVKAYYEKAEEEEVLIFKNMPDIFGNIFAIIVSVYPLSEYKEIHNEETSELLRNEAKIKEEEEKLTEKEKEEKFVLTSESLKEIQVDNLLNMMHNASKLYKENRKEIFEYNIKGISKGSSQLGFASVEELAGRISDACLFMDWDSIEPMLIELDRQSETIKAISGKL